MANRIGDLRIKHEGFKNPNDIDDLSTFADVEEEVVEVVDLAKSNIEVDLGDEAIAETKFAADIAIKFCKQLSVRYKKAFLEAMEKYSRERHKISPAIIKYLKEKGLDMPKFQILAGESAVNLLDDVEYDPNIISYESVLVNFQLPKPLAYYWWKDKEKAVLETDKTLYKATPTTIEWGAFYEKLMPVVHDLLESNYLDDKVYFRRVNALGHHDPEKFYYLWVLTKRK